MFILVISYNRKKSLGLFIFMKKLYYYKKPILLEKSTLIKELRVKIV